MILFKRLDTGYYYNLIFNHLLIISDGSRVVIGLWIIQKNSKSLKDTKIKKFGESFGLQEVKIPEK